MVIESWRCHCNTLRPTGSMGYKAPPEVFVPALEHAPKKLIGFFDHNMLQLVESERFLFDRMIPSHREAL
jgi:hypothetical protein